jgi:hypothetical protein
MFVNDRLKSKKKSFFDPIKRNKFPLFSRPTPKVLSAKKDELAISKSNCQLFSHLYIASQVRDGNLSEFFKHENQRFPPSISKNGDLRSGTKSTLIKCLEELGSFHFDQPTVEVIVVDGAAIVNMLKPGNAKTFADCSTNVFLPYIRKQLITCIRVDIVWDEYLENSLKSSARQKRGKGVRRRVRSDSKIPGNWQSFLRSNENKVELFKFLSEQCVKMETNGIVVASYGKLAISNSDKSIFVTLYTRRSGY